MKKLLSILLFIEAFCINNTFIAFSQSDKLKENVFVHLNKSVYITGEQVFYSTGIIPKNEAQKTFCSRIVYIELRNANNKKILNLRTNFFEKTTSGTFFIPDTLSSGYYQILAYTQYMRNDSVSEFYSQKILIINQVYSPQDSMQIRSFSKATGNIINEDKNNNVKCNISTDKQEYKYREKVHVEIQLNEAEQKTRESHFSVSVTPLSKIDSTSGGNSTISNQDSSQVSYICENEGYVLSGKVINKNTKQVIPNACVLLSAQDSIPNLKYCITTKTGHFYFKLNDFYDNKKLVLQLFKYKGNIEEVKFLIDDKYLPSTTMKCKIVRCDTTFYNIAKEQQQFALINKTYETNTPSTKKYTGKYSDTYFHFSYDDSIKTKDYDELPDFTELTKNILRTVHFSKINNSFDLQLIIQESKTEINTNTLVLLNNIPITDYSILESLGTNKLKDAEVVLHKIYFGEMVFDGILFLNTRDINFYPPEKMKSVCIIANQVNQPVGTSKNTESVSYLNKNIPDYRTSIFWNPEIRTDKEAQASFDFFTSDIPARYKIEIRGITGDYKYFKASYFIDVSNE